MSIAPVDLPATELPIAKNLEAAVLHVRVTSIEADGGIVTEAHGRLILAGLDQAYRLVPPNRYYLALLREFAGRAPHWAVMAARRDRFGRLTGQVRIGADIWLQEHLIRRGAARFAGGVAGPENRRRLLAAESVAREKVEGLWDSGHWSVKDADKPDRIIPGFQIVAGTVSRVARIGPRTYLNFGDDWREDFTVGSLLRVLDDGTGAAPEKLAGLEGRKVRVRGMVRHYNGPYLDLVSSDQIEFLDSTAE